MSNTDKPGGQRLDEELNRRIVRSSAWVGLGYGGGQVLSLGSMLVLVRLLDPQEFGVVAIGVTLLAVVSQIQESGLGAALVQGRHRDPRVAASSALVFAAVAGIALTAVTVALAPFYTRLLHLPRATEFVQVLALMLAIRGLSVVPSSILEREIDFRSRTHADLSGSVVQATVAIGCAVAGLGAWSLVAGQLSGSATQATIFWIRAPWRPSLRDASGPVLRDMLRYGRFVSGTNVMVVVGNNLDNAAVARFLGAGALGAYNVAWRLAELPNTVISMIVGRVMFTVYARLQHDLTAVRAAYVQNLQRTMLFALPATVTLGIAGEPIVLGLLGSDWTAAIGPLRLLAIFGLLRLLAGPSGELFKGIGRPHLTFVASAIFLAVASPSLIVLVPWLGPTGAAVGMVIGMTIAATIALAFTFRVLSLRPTDLARALARPVACSALVAAAVVAALPAADTLGALAALVLVATVAAGAFLLALALLARPLLTPIWAALRRT